MTSAPTQGLTNRSTLTKRQFLKAAGGGLVALPSITCLGLSSTSGSSSGSGPSTGASSQVFVSGILDRRIAAKVPGQGFGAAAFSAAGQLRWQVQLPARCHGQALHPSGAEVCVFARRPGEFFAIIDARTGKVIQQITPPKGRVFQGHGSYSLDGRYLYTSENAFDFGHGMIGVYERVERAPATKTTDVHYQRVGEFSSGAIGPHEILTLGAVFNEPSLLAVANGGIKTHPDFPRQKLNLESMSSELRLLQPRTGRTVARLSLAKTAINQQLSLRHMATHPSGKTLAVAAQHQQKLANVPLLYTIDLTTKSLSLTPVPLPAETLAQMKGYCGSVAYSPCGEWLYGSSPKGGVMVAFHSASQTTATMALTDGCGIASGKSCSPDALTVFSSGAGSIVRFAAHHSSKPSPAAFPHKNTEGSMVNLPLHFDNHLSRLS